MTNVLPRSVSVVAALPWYKVYFSWHGRSKVAIVIESQNTWAYFSALEYYLLPFIAFHLQNIICVRFQWYNALIHTAQVPNDWMCYNFIRTVQMLPRASDINLIKNIWTVLVRNVYKNECRYDNVENTGCEESMVQFGIASVSEIDMINVRKPCICSAVQWWHYQVMSSTSHYVC